LYGFGSNEFAQINESSSEKFATMVKMQVPPGMEKCKIVKLVCGCAHTMILFANDEIYGRGYNCTIGFFTV
jgi:alpha-tubulin suppressor-like RCC1 family protein